MLSLYTLVWIAYFSTSQLELAMLQVLRSHVIGLDSTALEPSLHPQILAPQAQEPLWDFAAALQKVPQLPPSVRNVPTHLDSCIQGQAVFQNETFCASPRRDREEKGNSRW